MHRRLPGHHLGVLGYYGLHDRDQRQRCGVVKEDQNTAKKPNPMLAAFEAKIRKEMAEDFEKKLIEFEAQKEAEFSQRLGKNTEINLIAMIIAGNDLGIMAEKRAGLMLEEHIDVKMRLVDELLEDAEDDPELVYTIYDLANRVKSILGPEGWTKYQKLFPMLRDYWDEEEKHD